MYRLSREEKQKGAYFSFFRFKDSVETSIRAKLQIPCYWNGIKNDGNNQFFSAMDSVEWFHNVRLEYNDLRIRIPYLHKTKEGFDVYQTYIQTNPSSEDLIVFAAITYVMNNLGLPIHDYYIAYLNGTYIREDVLDNEKLWIVSNTYNTVKGIPKITISDALQQKEWNFDTWIDDIRNLTDCEEVNKTKVCTRKTKCPYYETCFPMITDDDDDSLLHLSSCARKFEMYEEGLTKLKDADLDRIEGTRMQYAQIMASRNGGRFIDRLALENFMSRLSGKYITFVDFEWDTYALPPYKGMHCLQPLPFQYSMHIKTETGISHYEYLGFSDCREQFIQSLLTNTPKEGPIVAYNAKGAEQIRLRELQSSFPEYNEQLQNLIDRMIDLSVPFEMGMIYDLRMRGLYSLKVLSSMIHPDHNYRELVVSDGLKAVESHRKMEENPDVPKEEVTELLRYCSMDTSELLAVYQWLLEIIKA
ncbi:MAG: DUF2779 domain-containing protein [Erysipelotrichaceae bacterium]|nr:DUF2779 domain-containing protein [Erysipelotrichaceae bacterium]